MLVFNKGYKRQYVYGGSGLFTPMSKLISKLFSSSITKQLGSTAKDLAKTSAIDLARKVATVGRKAAIQTGKKAIDKGLDKSIATLHSKLLTPKRKSSLSKYTGINPEQIQPSSVKSGLKTYVNKKLNDGYNTLTQENKTYLNKLFNSNINNLIDGSGHNKKTITIQDFMKHMKGSGLKII